MVNLMKSRTFVIAIMIIMDQIVNLKSAKTIAPTKESAKMMVLVYAIMASGELTVEKVKI